MWFWLLLLAIDVFCGFCLGGSWTIVNIMLVPIIVLWNLLEVSVGKSHFLAEQSFARGVDSPEKARAVAEALRATPVVRVLHRIIFLGLVVYTVIVLGLCLGIW